MAPPKEATAKKPTYSFGDFGVINGQITGQKPGKGSKSGGKPAPKATPKKTPVENNESGIIKYKGLTVLTKAEKDRVLRQGDRIAGWNPFVGMVHVKGTHKPHAPLMRPDPAFLPDRATSTVSRPAGRGPVTKTSVPKPNNALGVQPRVKAPDFVMAMGLTVTYGGETKLNGGKPIDANYFTDVDDLK